MQRSRQLRLVVGRQGRDHAGAEPTPTPTPTSPPTVGRPGRVDGLRYSNRTGTSFTVHWRAPHDGGRALTGFGILRREDPGAWPPHSQAAVVGPGRRSYTFTGLAYGRGQAVQIRACNGRDRCGAWSSELRVPPLAGPQPSLRLPKETIAIGERIKVGAYDVPVGEVAYIQLEGPIQPAGRCSARAAGADAVARAPRPSTGPGYYDSMWIDGCAPGGTATIRLERQDRSRVFARATLTVAPAATERPGRVARPQVTAYNAALEVTWRPPSDGGAPAHYDVRHRPGTSGGWRERQSLDDGSMILDQLTNGVTYQVQVRACNTHGCSDSWSKTATGTPSGAAPDLPDPPGPDPTPVVDLPDCGGVATRDHTAPTGLNVIPLSGHQVRLTWTGSTGTTAGYTVEFNPHGANWPEKVPDSNKKSVVQKVTSTGPIKTCLDFSLDSMISRAPQDGDGLADNAAYDIRVRASKTVLDQTVEYVSEAITIIDTPITKADGYVPASQTLPIVGQADFTWTAVTDVLGDQYADGTYILRPRRLADHPASASWRPNAYAAANPDDTAPTAATEQTIAGLAPDEIYAVQLIYLPDDSANTNDAMVFSGRDVYVWPATTQLLVPGSGTSKLFARFPVKSRMPNTTYDYFICTDTFTENADTQAARDRRQAWVRFIVHALEQWELATNDTVAMTYLGESCTDFQPLVDMAAKRIAHLLPTEKSSIERHLTKFVQHEWHSQILPANTSDRDKNEIMMFDDYGDYPEGSTLYFAFTEAMSNEPVIETDYPEGLERIGKFGNRLGFVASTTCWGETSTVEAVACAHFSKRGSSPGYTTDIVLRRTRVDHDPLAIPGGTADLDRDGFPDVDLGDVVFNACPSMGRYTEWIPYDAQKNRDSSIYGTLVHEAGHALGIAHPLGIDDRTVAVTVSFKDTVMTGGKTYSCFPHPLDVLLVYALHRGR